MGKISLEEVYNQITNYIKKINFDSLWDGFKPIKFALYNNVECYFDGKYIDKTDDFMANTAIFYEGDYIAIWNLEYELPIEILVSKLIHEMFHGYQMINNESRFPDEMEALLKYKYSDGNLSLKYEESKILLKLFDSYDDKLFLTLLASRKYRFNNYQYEYQYEAKIEQIEGTANYIELMVLNQISKKCYLEKIEEIKKELSIKKNYLPIRIISYDIGAMILLIMKQNKKNLNYGFEDEPFSVEFIRPVVEKKLNVEVEFNGLIEQYYNTAYDKIKNAINYGRVAETEAFILKGVNIYDAIYYKDYIITNYFVMYEKNNNTIVLNGDYVVELKNGTGKKIYQIN